MTQTELIATKAVFVSLWPKTTLTATEWSVIFERAANLRIDGAQAEAALRNLKATYPKYPHVATILDALRRAQSPTIAKGTQQPIEQDGRSWGYRAAEMRDEYGLTSFERRVLEDEKFAAFAKKAGNLTAERLKDIRARCAAAPAVANTSTPTTREPDDDPFF